MGAPPVVVATVVAIEGAAAAAASASAPATAAGPAPGVLCFWVLRALLRVVFDLLLLETGQAEVVGVQALDMVVICAKMRSSFWESVSGGSSSLRPAMESDGDAPVLVSDTNLVWRGRMGVRRGETRSN